MRLFVALCCGMLAATLHAAPLQVRPWLAPDSKPAGPDRFPIVEGAPARAAAVSRINTLLWVRNFGVRPPSGPAAPGARGIAKPGRDGFSGFGYEVLRNDERILSLALHAQGCGAYCETFDWFPAFDVATGRQLRIDHLLTPAGRDALSRRLRLDRTALIRRTIARLERDLNRPREAGASTELIEVAVALYRECLPRDTDSELQGDESLGAWRIEARALVFVSEHCSTHATRWADELADFAQPVPFERLASSLTPYGRRLLLGDGTAAARLPRASRSSSTATP